MATTTGGIVFTGDEAQWGRQTGRHTDFVHVDQFGDLPWAHYLAARIDSDALGALPPCTPPLPQLGSTGRSSGRCPSDAAAVCCRSCGTSPYSVVRGFAGRPASSAMATRSWTDRYEP